MAVLAYFCNKETHGQTLLVQQARIWHKVNQRSQQRSSITFGSLQIPWFHEPCLKLTPEQKAIVAHYLLLLYDRGTALVTVP